MDWAIFYATLGWSVVPVRRGQKIPAVPWMRHQSVHADEATIRGWFDADPTFGVGLVQGRSANTIVLDFDAKSGGMETLAQLDAQGLPASVRAFTPGGGCHVTFRHPGCYVPTRKNVLPGMDVRGDGGFVVAHPSIHENGRAYHWDVDCHPEEAAVADCPADIASIVCGPVPASPDGADSVVRLTLAGPMGLPAERVSDGREQYMRDTVLAVLRDMRDTLGRLPSEDELFTAAWPQYSAKVDFTRGGRGPEEMRAKVRYTLARVVAGQIKGVSAAADLQPQQMPAMPSTVIDHDTGEVLALPATPFTAASLAGLQPRQWVYGHFLIERFLSVLGAPGGTGKSAYGLGVALSVALNRSLMDEKVHKAGPVWIYNLEDPQDEALRRVWATCLHHGIDPAELEGRLYLDSGRDRPLVVAERDKDGDTIALPIVDALIAELKARNVRLLIVDPFVKSHRLEENRNEQVDFAATLWNRVADQAGCAILLMHHFRKGGESGSADAFRGASALIDASRAAVTLAVMSEREAGVFGVDPDQRRFFIRADNAKLNLAPPPTHAVWLKLNSVELPNGDFVQAVSRWEPPSPWQGVPMALIVQMVERIAAGRGDGQFWSPDIRAKANWAGQVIVEDAAKTQEQAASMIKAWSESKLLISEEYHDPKRGEKRQRFVVDTSKLQEMRNQMRSEANTHD